MMSQVFRGRTLAEARRAAEAELGSDAVLLTTRKVKRRGLLGLLGSTDVEISAAAPSSLLPAGPPSAPGLKKAMPFSEAVYRSTDGAALPQSAPIRSEDLTAMRTEFRNEIRAMQTILTRAAAQQQHPGFEGELSALRDAIEQLSSPTPQAKGAVGRLLRAKGIEGKAVSLITRALRDRKGNDETPEEALRDALADIVEVAPWPLAGDERKLIALVGPSGIGKTTTAAKLAARAILEEDRSVTLISCDVSRVGATEQLKRYAQLMEANFEIAPTPADLQRIIASAKTDLVIVDTAGKIAMGPESVEASLGGKIKGKSVDGRSRHVLLCVPAALRANDADRYWRVWRNTAPSALVVTKLDETEAPAGLIHAAVASGLPVTALCFGHRVPEDIGPATMGAILDHLARPGNGWRQAS